MLGTRRLDFQVKAPGTEHSSSNVMQQNAKTSGNQTVRTLTVSYYAFGSRGEASATPVVLVVRLPEEIKRERVKFTMKSLDLF